MLVKISFILLINCVLLVKSHARDLGDGTPGALLPDYNCSGKDDGYYAHPNATKCSSYVLCVEQRSAYEMTCGFGPDKLQLHFVANSGPDPDQAYCDEPARAGCDPWPVSTTTTTELPNPDLCDPDNCQLTGNCRHYFKCVPDPSSQGHLERAECGIDLFWNPLVNNIHGGVCDYFDNLNSTIQEQYENDPDCILPCDWFQTPAQECSREYTYRTKFEGTTEDREVILKCPAAPDGHAQLFWSNDARRTCVKCPDAVDSKGNPCNCIDGVRHKASNYSVLHF